MSARPRTRVVATVGPATSTAAAIDALLAAGIDVARVNCAHGDADGLRATIALLQERRDRAGVPLAILADLAGPKLRIGRLAGGTAELVAGAALTLTTEDVVGDASRVPVNYAGLPGDVTPGMRIFLNDGLLSLVVTDVRGGDVATRVEVGGTLTDRGQDLLHLKLTREGDNYSAVTTQIARGFKNPIDAVLIENRLYVLEFSGDSTIWELTFQ